MFKKKIINPSYKIKNTRLTYNYMLGKGGCYINEIKYCTSSIRGYDGTEYVYPNVGFRIRLKKR